MREERKSGGGRKNEPELGADGKENGHTDRRLTGGSPKRGTAGVELDNGDVLQVGRTPVLP